MMRPSALMGAALGAVCILGTASALSSAAASTGRHRAVSMTAGPVVNVSRMSGDQDEPAVAVQRTDPRHAVIVSNLNLPTSHGLLHAWTTDGGSTWNPRRHPGWCDRAACCNGSLAADGFSNIFLTYIHPTDARVPVEVSTDGGATFATVASSTRVRASGRARTSPPSRPVTAACG
jgi:hypothetical protein